MIPNCFVGACRCLDQPEVSKGKLENSKAVVLLPGPKEPKRFKPYFELVAKDLHKYGPNGNANSMLKVSQLDYHDLWLMTYDLWTRATWCFGKLHFQAAMLYGLNAKALRRMHACKPSITETIAVHVMHCLPDTED